jgi:hypothetical protein
MLPIVPPLPPIAPSCSGCREILLAQRQANRDNCRWVYRVAAKVADEVLVLFEHRYIDARRASNRASCLQARRPRHSGCRADIRPSAPGEMRRASFIPPQKIAAPQDKIDWNSMSTATVKFLASPVRNGSRSGSGWSFDASKWRSVPFPR